MNLKKYNQVFSETFGVTDEAIMPTMKYNESQNWDSIGQMMLCVALEEAFDIHLEGNDLLDLQSYAAGIDILAKYGVSLQEDIE